MKYMGSKRLLLTNGLGEAIVSQARSATRVVDLFTGSGVVAWFAAENTDVPVYAVDLQSFAVALADGIVSRTRAVDVVALEESWLAPSRRAARRSKPWTIATSSDTGRLTKRRVLEARELCGDHNGAGPIWSAYGGHYFSPGQALQFDAALRRLPEGQPARAVCRAALITAASYCAAAPGHTAQPFQPTKTSLPYIADAWNRNPIAAMREALRRIGLRRATRRGRAIVGDAVQAAKGLRSTDLVIIDPPYSDVQYSRFYHVLETIARGEHAGVSGVGRYPPWEERPRSAFSVKTESAAAVEELLDILTEIGCRAIITFPAGAASNGVSGSDIFEMAARSFDVEAKTVLGRFSTLGGNNTKRASRAHSAELILSLAPRR
jgi:adenine-specific DNA-methyltransferase